MATVQDLVLNMKSIVLSEQQPSQTHSIVVAIKQIALIKSDLKIKFFKDLHHFHDQVALSVLENECGR